MNKIYQLFDEQYAKEYLTRKLLPLYPDFSEINSLKIRPYKKMIWDSTYHVVVEFTTIFRGKDGRDNTLPIIASAHSSEPRQLAHESLKYLWEHGFGESELSVPHPLFYSEYFNANFDRAAAGHNLYRFIREKDKQEIERVLPQTAAWFAKLHNLPSEQTPNFNYKNSRIKTVSPGLDHILLRVREHHPEYLEAYNDIYAALIRQETTFFHMCPRRWLVHGDAHPENIIRQSARKIAAIDFTDLCLADHARDLGAFTQQLEYMCNRKIGEPAYAEYLKKLFLDSYFLHFTAGVNFDISERIRCYYNYTAMRTATHFLLKFESETERARPLIEAVAKDIL